MLAAGRSFPAVTAARRAAAARSTGAQRSSAILIRTLSSEGTPGTVAGARAAASAGAAPKPSVVGGGSGGGGGGGGGGGSGGGGGAARLVAGVVAIVGMDMLAYAKIPIFKDAVDTYMTLPPEVYDIYRRCGLDVDYPRGRKPTRDAWRFGLTKKAADKAPGLSSAGGGGDKPNEKTKAGGFEIDTSGLNKGFSISTPSQDTTDSTSSTSSTSTSGGGKSYSTPTPISERATRTSATAPEETAPASSAWRTGAIPSGSGGGETTSLDGGSGSSSSSSAIDFIGGGDAAVGEAAVAAEEAVAPAAAFSSTQEDAGTASKEEEEDTASASDLSSSSWSTTAEAAVQEAEALAASASAAASDAASDAAAAASAAAGGALASGAEALASESIDDAVGYDYDASSSAQGSSLSTEDDSATLQEADPEAGDAGQPSPESEPVSSSTSQLVAALREKEEREMLAREELESKKRRIRNEALSTVAEEMEVASAGLKRELEQSVLKDLKDLDEDALRFRVAQLATEIQERTKWEALRLMEGVQKKEAEIGQKYEALLSEQKDLYDTETGRALRDQEHELSTAFVEKYGEQLRMHLESQANEFKEALHANAVAGREALTQELEAKHAEAVAELKAQEIKNSEMMVDELRELSNMAESKIMEVEAARRAEEADRIAGENVHRVTHATLSLAERFATSTPIKKELDSLRALAGGDPLLEAAAASIPQDAAAKGIPTPLQLKQRFGVVKAECRRAALVPKQAGNGMMGHLVASALAKLTFEPKGMVEGDGAEGVLARADYLLEAGELESAVGELEKLNGLAADVAVDWLKDAKTRLTADEALRVIRCHASLLNAERLKSLDGQA